MIDRSLYQVGGSLQLNAPSYIARPADTELFQALMAGEFCYVFNARQMGKSSLRVHMQRQLWATGKRCVSLDLTSLGSEHVTPSQWYRGLILELLTKFDLHGVIDFKRWWETCEGCSDIQRLRLFIEMILLTHYPEEDLFIFVDEIDSALALPFSVNDFFALVRYCYNQRADNRAYTRLTWALFGVVTPSDLITDGVRTPFNIGRAIALSGFTLDSAKRLADGLEPYVAEPQEVLQAILAWTEGQPFLTQKLCDLVVRQAQAVAQGTPCQFQPDPADRIKALVGKHILDYWESQDNPEHLRTIRDRILRDEQKAGRLLSLYHQILLCDPDLSKDWAELTPMSLAPCSLDGLRYDDSPEQMDLLLSGLVENRQGTLRVKNRIYREIFNLRWVDQQLATLRPYSESLLAWLASGQSDESRLLTGKALRDAQNWSQGKSLSDVDYQFLAASQKSQQRAVSNKLKAARTEAVITRLKQQRRSLQQLSVVSAILSLALSAAIAFGMAVVRQSRQLAAGEVVAIATTADALFASEHRLDSLLTALAAARTWQKLNLKAPRIQEHVTSTLQQAVFGIAEVNRFSGHLSGVQALAISPNGRFVVSGSHDNTLRLWDRRGQTLRVLKDHTARIQAVDISPDSQIIASVSEDYTLKLWDRSGQLLRTIRGHTGAVNAVAFSPTADTLLASASDDQTVRLWKPTGEVVATLTGQAKFTDVVFSPDGQILAASNQAGEVRLWRRDGRPLLRFQAHATEIYQLAFSPNGQQLASASQDGTARLWNLEGKEVAILRAHDAPVATVAYSPNGEMLATASWDRTIRLWNAQGQWLTTFKGHGDRVLDIQFSPDSQQLFSAAFDKTIRVWSLNKFVAKSLLGHQADVIGLAISPSGQVIASGGDDSTLKLWNRRGQLIVTVPHPDTVLDIAFTPDGRTVVTADWDGKARLWTLDGTLITTLVGHREALWGIAVNPDGQTLATASADHTVRFWDLQGRPLHSLTAHNQEVRDIAYSPGGQYLATAGLDGTVKLWDRFGRHQKTLEGQGSQGFNTVAISPDGQLIAAGGFDQTIEIWGIAGEHLATLVGHNQEVRHVAFNADSSQLVSASGDGTIKLWSIRLGDLEQPFSGQLVATLRGHTAAVWKTFFTPGEAVIVSASEDRTLTIWQPSIFAGLDQLINYGCNTLRNYLKTNPDLTDEDRQICD